jgi:hypothetical protein
MGAKKPVFRDFAQRKCPVFLTTYARFGKLLDLSSINGFATDEDLSASVNEDYLPSNMPVFRTCEPYQRLSNGMRFE